MAKPGGGAGNDDENNVRQQCYGVRGDENKCMGVLFVFAKSVAAVRAADVPEAWVKVFMINQGDQRRQASRAGLDTSDGRGSAERSRDSDQGSEQPSSLQDRVRGVGAVIRSPEFVAGMREAFVEQGKFIGKVVGDVASGEHLSKTAQFARKLASRTAAQVSEWWRGSGER